MDMNDAIIGVGGRTTSVAEIVGNSDPWEARSTHTEGAIILAYNVGSQRPIFGTLVTWNYYYDTVRVQGIHALTVLNSIVFCVLKTDQDAWGSIYMTKISSDGITQLLINNYFPQFDDYVPWPQFQDYMLKI